MTSPHLDGVTFEHYAAPQARDIGVTVEDVYRRSYVDAIASGDPFHSPQEFMRRFDAYTSRSQSGFTLVLARINGEPVGQTWGWPLPPNTGWWLDLELDDGDPAVFTAENGSRTFALSEIMVCSGHTGHGIARQLHDELLGGRPEQRATLLVDPENTRAYNTYRHWGWYKVGTLRPNWENAPTFDVLIKDLKPTTA
jgi:ribosomal protein S18 acetylase RimI-like enzyme